MVKIRHSRFDTHLILIFHSLINYLKILFLCEPILSKMIMKKKKNLIFQDQWEKILKSFTIELVNSFTSYMLNLNVKKILYK